MTTATAPLITLVQQWERRRQWGVVLTWLPRTVIPGLLIGIAIVGFSRFYPGLPDSVNLALTVAACLIGMLVLFGMIWLRPRPLIHVARRFDRYFGLKERLSTALELMDGTIHGDPDLTALQLADAQSVALSLTPEKDIPLRVEVREWLIVLALAAALLMLLLLPPAVSRPDEITRQRAAIDTSVEAVEEILRDIAQDPNLTDEQRQPLLEALETQLETLRDPNVSMDEAFASLSEIENQLNDAAESVREQMTQQEQANQEALSAMQRGMPNEQAAGAESLEQAMQQMQQGIPQMSQEQMSQAADSLEQAAQALESTDPQTAQALQDAADALRDGDTQAAQEALKRAMEGRPERGERSESQLEQLQTNAQAANQAQQDAAEQADSESQEPPQSGEGEKPGEGEQGNPGDGQGSETGTEPGDGDTPGLGEGDSAELGSQQSSQSITGQQGLGGDGAGDGATTLNQDATERLQTRNPNLEQPDNNPDGRGEAEYEAIFAPRYSVEGTGDGQIELAADPGELPTDEGDFQDNPFGQSVVPYSQVFSDYSDSATRALESDYIPLGLRDVVRQYFSSLDPASR